MVSTEGMAELVYELHLTNFADAALNLRSVRIFDADNGKPLLALDGAGLAGRFALAALPRPPAATSVEPGRHAIVYLEINLKPGAVPAGLVHELEYSAPGGNQTYRVRGGQVMVDQAIGALGFTGDTTGPHLHFHVSDTNSPLGAEGKPFAFDRFTLLGRYPDMGTFGKGRWQAISPELAARRSEEWPAPNTVLQFGD